MSSSKSIGAFFEDKWALYQKMIRGNVLCHGEMFAALDHLLLDRFGSKPFTFADFGCGDGSAVLETLRNKSVSHYTGVDAASDLIAAAAGTLADLNCPKRLICQDL